MLPPSEWEQRVAGSASRSFFFCGWNMLEFEQHAVSLALEAENSVTLQIVTLTIHPFRSNVTYIENIKSVHC